MWQDNLGVMGQVRHFGKYLLLTHDNPHDSATRDVGVMLRNFLVYRFSRLLPHASACAISCAQA